MNLLLRFIRLNLSSLDAAQRNPGTMSTANSIENPSLRLRPQHATPNLSSLDAAQRNPGTMSAANSIKNLD